MVRNVFKDCSPGSEVLATHLGGQIFRLLSFISFIFLLDFLGLGLLSSFTTFIRFGGIFVLLPLLLLVLFFQFLLLRGECPLPPRLGGNFINFRAAEIRILKVGGANVEEVLPESIPGVLIQSVRILVETHEFIRCDEN